MPKTQHIAIINPNSSLSMTEALEPVVNSLDFNNTTYTYHTSPPAAPSSINNPTDASLSTSSFTSLPNYPSILSSNAAFLVACYSPHPLVSTIKSNSDGKPVIGIFHASVSAALNLLSPPPPRKNGDTTEAENAGGGKFGIVTTGESWKQPLDTAVRSSLLSANHAALFAGVECVGLNAGDLHPETSADVVRQKVKAATTRLLGDERVEVVVLGCAGMVGMDQWVREAAKEVKREVRVVDGVKAGVGVLQGLLRLEAS